jgi:hypothetical protein
MKFKQLDMVKAALEGLMSAYNRHNKLGKKGNK